MDDARKLNFKCKWSKSTIVITSFVLVITLPMIFLLLLGTIWVYLSLAFVYGVLGYYAFISPMRLIIDKNQIIIKRIFGKVSIPIEDIQEIRLLAKVDTRSFTRRLGSEGYFGYTGWFYNKSLGNYYMYATDENKLILIRTEKKKYVVSCDEPWTFVKTVKSFCDIS